ncbi:MAG: DUF2007 domain-containing protein [Pseudomonadota bacterium]
MRDVYEAANALEAHMIAGMLGQLGMTAHVAGEHLQSAAGEMPMAGLVRLQVADEDYARAREAILDWERRQPPPEAAPAMAPPRSPWPFALAGLLAGVALAWLLLAREEGRAFDYNEDGMPDEELFYVQDVIQRAEMDRNGNGKPDEIADYDRRGLIQRIRSDDDFNGVFEGETTFVNGQAVAWIHDHDQDGRIDSRGKRPTPALEYVEILDQESGAVIRRSRWCMNRLQAELVDTDHDGRVDTANLYDPRGDIERSNRDLDAAMSLDCPAKLP